MNMTKTPAVLEHVNLTANVFVKAKKLPHIDSSKKGARKERPGVTITYSKPQFKRHWRL